MLDLLRSPTKSSLVWWLLFCLQLAGLGVAYHFDLYSLLNTADATKLSWVTLGLYGLATLLVGWKTLEDDAERLEPFWFTSELLLGLGMLGTLIGFIMMLSVIFSEIDPSKVETIRQALSSMGRGMSTAIWTTVIGLACSLLLKLQLVNLEHQ